MFDIGSSSNQITTSQQFANNQNFSFMLGDDNDSGASDFGGQTASQEQSRKDDLGLSASVAVGMAGGASSGTASTAKSSAENDTDTFGEIAKDDNKIIYLVIAGLGALALIFTIATKKKG